MAFSSNSSGGAIQSGRMLLWQSYLRGIRRVEGAES